MNELVVGALVDRLLTADRLTTLLREVQRHRKTIASDAGHRRASFRNRIKGADTRVGRLYAALAEGTVTDTSKFRETLKAIEAERDECIRLLGLLDVEVPALRQSLSKQQAQSVAATLRRRLLEAPPPVKRCYVRGLVSQIVVDKEMAVISGPPAAVAAAATSGALSAEFRGFVREWWAQQDSNLRPAD